MREPRGQEIDMTKAQEVYADTLNLIGSDLTEEPEIRMLLDHEHALADPAFELALSERRAFSVL